MISSIQAAGYADFMKILDERWGGLEIQVADVVVQGVECPEQVVRALTNFNKSGRVDVIAIVRGGGSIQDLAAFNDEALVRAVASSKIPIISGIGHEIDETLVDLAADMRASTPSNAAQILTPISKHYYVKDTYDNVLKIGRKYLEKISETSITIQQSADTAAEKLIDHIDIINSNVRNSQKLLEQVNPENVLRRGYGLIRGELTTGSTVNITTHNNIAELEVKNVHKR